MEKIIQQTSNDYIHVLNCVPLGSLSRRFVMMTGVSYTDPYKHCLVKYE